MRSPQGIPAWDQLSLSDDPSLIPTEDFVRNGRRYYLLDMTRKDEVGVDIQTHTETVTQASDTNNLEAILQRLDAEMEVTTEDGYVGVLRLDHTSVLVTTDGYATKTSTLTASRSYPNLSEADVSLIPKSIEDRGKTLTLGDVKWSEVYEYAYTGPGSSYHPSNDVQAVMVGELNVTRELYSLIIKKVDSTNPNKTLPGARFLVASENGSYSKEVVTGGDGTVTVPQLEAGTYAVTELEAPEGYEIDNAGRSMLSCPTAAIRP